MAEVEKSKQKKNIFKRSFSEYIWDMHCLKTEKNPQITGKRMRITSNSLPNKCIPIIFTIWTGTDQAGLDFTHIPIIFNLKNQAGL